MPALCNLDGSITDEAEARVPVLDRGFLFGDSVYEVIRTRGGKLFAWREHLLRLRASAQAVGMALDLDDPEILRRIVQTVDRSQNPECYIRIIVTRGTGTAPNIDLATASGPPRWIILVRPPLQRTTNTVRLWLVDRLRNDRRALDPATKSGNYLNNVLGLAEAKARGATDCLFLNGEGQVTEASTSNVFARIGSEIVTPPLEAGILAGITRAQLIDVMRERGATVAERHLRAHDLENADELWLSSTLRDVAPVTHLGARELPPATFARELGAAFGKWAATRAVADDAEARAMIAG